MHSLQLDNAFWRFSLRVYGASGVAEECLALQRSHGIDVNLLLLSAWLGAARGIALQEALWARLAGRAEAWQREVVAPLRSARRQLKLLPEMAHPQVQAFRAELAKREIEAEQIEQALLFAEAEPWRADADADRAQAARRNVGQLLSLYDPALGPDRCERLIAAALAARDLG